MIKYLFAILVFVATPCHADVRLPRIIGSRMVLQRERDVKIWGWAGAGERVRVVCDWRDTVFETTADKDGKWEIGLTTGKAGGPHKISIMGENTIQLDDILFGEVWIGSGQSNMEMPLAKDCGREQTFSGPIYRSVAFENGEARLTFEFADGLATRDGKAPSHFEIAGADKKFVTAEARIEGNVVLVASDKVANPRAARYAFSSDAMPNLMNQAGLPASSFRTDPLVERGRSRLHP